MTPTYKRCCFHLLAPQLLQSWNIVIPIEYKPECACYWHPILRYITFSGFLFVLYGFGMYVCTLTDMEIVPVGIMIISNCAMYNFETDQQKTNLSALDNPLQNPFLRKTCWIWSLCQWMQFLHLRQVFFHCLQILWCIHRKVHMHTWHRFQFIGKVWLIYSLWRCITYRWWYETQVLTRVSNSSAPGSFKRWRMHCVGGGKRNLLEPFVFGIWSACGASIAVFWNEFSSPLNARRVWTTEISKKLILWIKITNKEEFSIKQNQTQCKPIHKKKVNT